MPRRKRRYKPRIFSIGKRFGPGILKVKVRTRKKKLPKLTISYEVPA